MPIRCHFRDCKALLATSLTHVSSAAASNGLYRFTFRAGWPLQRYWPSQLLS